MVVEKQRQLSLVEEKNRQLQNELRRVQGTEYVESEAREKLGMGKTDEKVVIMPQITPGLEEALRQAQGKPASTRQSLVLSRQSASPPNWQKWWQLFIY